MNETVTINPDSLLEQIDGIYDKLSRGEVEDARANYVLIKNLSSTDARCMVRLAELALKFNESTTSIDIYRRLVEQYPDKPAYRFNLYRVHMSDGDIRVAQAGLKQLIAEFPGFYQAYLALAHICTTRKYHLEAVEYLMYAINLQPDNYDVLLRLSNALLTIGRSEEASQYVERLTALKPEDGQTMHVNGWLHTQAGRFEQAQACYMRAIESGHRPGLAYYHLAAARKFTSDDKQLIELFKNGLNRQFPPQQQANLLFALGKVHDDIGEYDKAFDYYHQANQTIKPAVHDKAASVFFDSTASAYVPELFDKARVSGDMSRKPVFVVGMPRSGTTLIERIIASHPEAYGRGELQAIEDVHARIFNDDTSRYVETLLRASEDGELKKGADDYMKVLSSGAGNARYLVDKMPDNYLLIGFIHLLFPEARIVHVKRSMLDICLSCYFQNFREMPWTFDLDWIAERYRLYQRAMKHWRSVLPPDSILEVEYEDVVRGQESETRRIIDFLGLEWDEACLDLTMAKQSVSTASVWQVRQKIYKTSARRWLNYAQHIAPLANMLYEYLDESEIAAFSEQGVKLNRRAVPAGQIS